MHSRAYFILLYANEIVLFSDTLKDMQYSMDVFEPFYRINKLIVKVDKTKMMVIKAIQPRRYSLQHTRQNQYMWCETSNILVLMSLDKQVECMLWFQTSSGWNSYYKFKNKCKNDVGGWKVKLMLFNSMMVYCFMEWKSRVTMSHIKSKLCSYVDNWG